MPIYNAAGGILLQCTVDVATPVAFSLYHNVADVPVTVMDITVASSTVTFTFALSRDMDLLKHGFYGFTSGSYGCNH
jgi:hypothetical protein